MRVNIKGLINRLDDLRERLNELFDKLEKLDDLGHEETAIEDVKQHFENDDTFNLSIALDVLEQADKLDKASEIIKEKRVDVHLLEECECADNYNWWVRRQNYRALTQEEYEILKEVKRYGQQ